MMAHDHNYSPPDPSMFGGNFDPLEGAPYLNEVYEEIPPPSVPARPVASTSEVTISAPPRTQTGMAEPTGVCALSSCKSTRIAVSCGRKRCKKHCKEAGGCMAPGHVVNVHTAVPSSGATNRLTLAVSTNRLAHLASQASVSSTTTATPSQPTPVTASSDGVANPVFISQMPSIFTDQHAAEQRLREAKRKEDEERLANAKKTKESVVVYSWAHVRDKYFSSSFSILMYLF